MFHKNCAKVAPPICGLPRDFLNYARQHFMMSPSHDSVYQVNSNNASATTPTKNSHLTNSGEYGYGSSNTPTPSSEQTREDTFIIQDLNREPSKSKKHTHFTYVQYYGLPVHRHVHVNYIKLLVTICHWLSYGAPAPTLTYTAYVHYKNNCRGVGLAIIIVHIYIYTCTYYLACKCYLLE